MSDSFIQVKNLQKNYNSLKAVDRVSFHINEGEIFGLLGPNGAGKTTTVEIMEGLRKCDGGTVQIDGMDPQKNDFNLKQIIGVQLQKSAMEENIKPWEALKLFGSYYKKHLAVDDLLHLVGLIEKRNTYFSKLSGGQQQRLSLAIALVNDPQMVFLDEPTTGLDAQARRTIWEIIEQLKKQNKTVLLTTHYIEEAERLCDRVAIIDNGQIIATGTPIALIENSGISHKIFFKTKKEPGKQLLDSLSEKYGEITQENGLHSLKSDQASKPLVDLIKLLEAENNELVDLHLTRPTLEDVFLKLTGRRMRD